LEPIRFGSGGIARDREGGCDVRRVLRSSLGFLGLRDGAVLRYARGLGVLLRLVGELPGLGGLLVRSLLVFELFFGNLVRERRPLAPKVPVGSFLLPLLLCSLGLDERLVVVLLRPRCLLIGLALLALRVRRLLRRPLGVLLRLLGPLVGFQCDVLLGLPLRD